MHVSCLGFGCGGLSRIYNAPLSLKDGCSIIKQVFSTWITFLDASDLYGHKYDSEIMLGKVTYYPTTNQSFLLENRVLIKEN